MKDSRIGSTPLVLGGLVILFLCYVGAYLMLVKPKFGGHGLIAYEGRAVYYHGYRNGGDWAWRVFLPLEQADRKLRPKAWSQLNVRNIRHVR